MASGPAVTNDDSELQSDSEFSRCPPMELQSNLSLCCLLPIKKRRTVDELSHSVSWNYDIIYDFADGASQNKRENGKNKGKKKVSWFNLLLSLLWIFPKNV